MIDYIKQTANYDLPLYTKNNVSKYRTSNYNIAHQFHKNISHYKHCDM